MLRRAPYKPPVAQLNPHLTCVLCNGYFIDATTIIECLHSFCKSCIVKYLEANKFCPVCEVQVHKTKPLLNVRSDKTLQDLVYKLVPGLFQREMRLRRNYYNKHPEQSAKNPSDGGEESEETCFIYSSDETICLSLEYAPPSKKENEDSTEEEKNKVEASRRYLRCPAAVTVDLLKRLIRGKYGLSENHAVDFLYQDAYLCDEYSLVDLAYIYDWRRKGPMRLRYRIYQYTETPNNIPPPVVPEPLKNGIKDIEEKQVPVKEEKPLQESITVIPDKKEEVITEAQKSTLSQFNGPIITTDVKDKSEREKMPPPLPAISLANGTSSKPPATTSSSTTVTQSSSIKVPAKTWNPQKTALKRLAVPEDASASPIKKTPRFFKRSLLPSVTPQQLSASVTESPVQEVAVNLSKPSPPLPSKPLKVDHKAVVPVSSSPSIRPRATTPSSTGHPYPSWLRSGGFTPPPPPPPNQIRSTSSMIPSFPPRHFISGFYHPYLPASMSFPAPLPPPPPETKSSTKTSSATSSVPISSSSSPRFPTPTFSLSGYPGAGAAGFSPLLAGLSPRDLVGSFYNSYAAAAAAAAAAAQQQRPFFTPGGFHSSLPPTVVTSSAHHHGSSKAKSSSSSGSLRPLIPRKHPVVPPPALVPLRTTAPVIREPPTLLPIEDGTVEKDIKKSVSSAHAALVESILPLPEKSPSPIPSPIKPDSESKDPQPSPGTDVDKCSISFVENDSTTESKPVENGAVEKETSPSPPSITADVNGSTDSTLTTTKSDKEATTCVVTTEVEAEHKTSTEQSSDVKETVEECSKSELEATLQ